MCSILIRLSAPFLLCPAIHLGSAVDFTEQQASENSGTNEVVNFADAVDKLGL